jgi:pilus assembly protein CpaE
VLDELAPNHLASVATELAPGLSVLCGPADPLTAERFGGEHARALIRALRQHYSLVILDLPTALSPVTLAALEEADLILLVTTPDALAVWNLQTSLAALDRLRLDRRRMALVVNRVSSRSELQARDILGLVPLPLLGEVQAAFLQVQPYINSGQPLVTGNKAGPGGLTRDILRLADKVAAACPGSGSAAHGGMSGHVQPFRY